MVVPSCLEQRGRGGGGGEAGEVSETGKKKNSQSKSS